MGGCFAVNLSQNSQTLFTRSSLTFQQLLGSGEFGKVWKAVHKVSNKEYAIKVMSKNRIMAKKSSRAVVLQKKIHEYLSQERSELIVNLIASSQDRQKLYLVMQYVEGSNLRTHMQAGLTLTEPQIKHLTTHLFKSLRFIHSKCIIHGDVKPQNIIIDQHGTPKIMDFGLSNCYTKHNSGQNGGTLVYKAPEVLQERNHTYSVDDYAVGIIAYELFFKRRPRHQTSIQQLKKQILTRPINLSTCPELSTISRDAADFIERLLQLKAEDRLGFNSSDQIFQHPWLKSDISSSSKLQKDKTHYLQSLAESRGKRESTDVQSDSEEDNMESVKRLLDKEHIQKKFEAFSQPFTDIGPILPNTPIKQLLRQNIQSISSTQIKIQLKKMKQP